MDEKVVAILKQRRSELAAIEATWANWSRVTEWHARTRPLIAQYFEHQIEPIDKLIEVRWAAFVRRYVYGGPNDTSRVDAAERLTNDKMAAGVRGKLLAHIDALLELLDLEQPIKSAGVPLPQTGVGVFLVHGRDERWVQGVARFVEQFGLKITILREQSNQGRTVIEKFEDVAADIGFAIVLLTGDDRGGLADTKPSSYLPRARQNVILELGFFLGRLRRSHVCALYEHGVEIPSDYSGVLFVPIDESGGWRLLLAREMKAAGLPIDMNRAI